MSVNDWTIQVRKESNGAWTWRATHPLPQHLSEGHRYRFRRSAVKAARKAVTEAEYVPEWESP